MLIEFRLSNFRSIAEEQVLSLAAASEEDEGRPRRVRGFNKALLPAVAIYGANASGKTSVLGGLRYMREAVLFSHRIWQPDGGTNREPFAWGGLPGQPSMFEVLILISGIRYRYGFRVNDQIIVEEWLYAWPNGRKQVWLERDNSSFKFGEALSGEKTNLIESVTRPNALFLSTAAQHADERLMVVFTWFVGLGTLNLGGPFSGTFLRNSTAQWVHTASLKEKERARSETSTESAFRLFMEILRTADLGIVDIRTEERQSPKSGNPFGLEDTRPQIKVFLLHQSSDENAWLPIESESSGTAALFNGGKAIVEALVNGWVIIIDELERSLHPMIALRIVSLFNDVKTNPHNAQLIFSTHDSNLLGRTLDEPALRRDQVWLTEKNAEGATTLYPLTDFKARKEENLERGYLQGRYGAVPMLGLIDFPDTLSNGQP